MPMHQPGDKEKAYEAYDRLVIAYDKMISFSEDLPAETEVFQALSYTMNVLRAYLVDYDSHSDGGVEALIKAILEEETPDYIGSML